ncbi:MAG: leucyl aminopeptidase [Nitrospinae bacterium RIFCSPLOWO2_12_FULL_45_22]|nr:MAG: leucyl aminopeptidase [Nitrospinae bacterium RIFCSPLOWO2_12_FULL_45_22]
MKITVKSGNLKDEIAEAIVVGLFDDRGLEDKVIQELDQALGGMIKEIWEAGDFKGKADQVSIIYPRGAIPSKRVVLMGLGKEEKFDLDKIREAAGRASKRLQKLGVKSFSTILPDIKNTGISVSAAAQATIEGCVLGTYQFKEYKTGNKDELKEIEGVCLVERESARMSKIEPGAKTGEIIALAVSRVRDLVNHPGNAHTPKDMAEEAQKIAQEAGLACQILDENQIRELNMGAFMAVAQGSQQPPRFIILEHNQPQEGRPTIVVIGKGITFDSGGISIKPSEKMEEMKYDMAGGAAVLGTMQAIAKLKLPIHVVGLVPATENLPSGSALKPGDIIKSLSGKTIEVISTDAEGRLILADALTYAERYNPTAVIDLATLTGACVIALGHIATGTMGNDPDLIARIKKAGEVSGERVWELPLWEEYNEQIKSDIADLKNVGGRPAGTITGAAFLGKFAEKYKWVHLDIAGTAWSDKDRPYIPKGATGVGVRLLVQFLRDWLA